VDAEYGRVEDVEYEREYRIELMEADEYDGEEYEN
jgi:hypothetical protein